MLQISKTQAAGFQFYVSVCSGQHASQHRSTHGWRNGMTTAAQTVTRNAPETDSRKTQVTVSRAIHVLSTEDQPRQVMSHRDRMCRNLESGKNLAFSLAKIDSFSRFSPPTQTNVRPSEAIDSQTCRFLYNRTISLNRPTRGSRVLHMQ